MTPKEFIDENYFSLTIDCKREISEIYQALEDYTKTKQLTLTNVSFSLFDKVYMDSPFGRYTGVVKGVEEGKVTIESHSPNGKGMMLADYDLTNNDWQKY